MVARLCVQERHEREAVLGPHLQVETVVALELPVGEERQDATPARIRGLCDRGESAVLLPRAESVLKRKNDCGQEDRSGHPTRGPRPRDITSQTQTPAAQEPDATAAMAPLIRRCAAGRAFFVQEFVVAPIRAPRVPAMRHSAGSL